MGVGSKLWLEPTVQVVQYFQAVESIEGLENLLDFEVVAKEIVKLQAAVRSDGHAL